MAVAQGVSAAVPAVSYPGLPATAAGPEMVVWVETQVSQGACAYPITLSTNMGAGYQAAQAAGRKNLWGEPLFFLELESEHSSASTCEGFALAGGQVADFVAFARAEGRFARQFDAEGRPSPTLVAAQADRLANLAAAPGAGRNPLIHAIRERRTRS
jgi:hypothetical protein